MAPTVYVITNYAQNHGCPDYRGQPLDPRFLDSDRNYVYFLIDQEVPELLRDKRVLFEKQIDPRLARFGAKHMAEWAFFLMEAEHAFCEYPFYAISSRFYEKNAMLGGDLNSEWDRIFAGLERYGWGYLPSYDRPLRWLDYEYEKQTKWGSKVRFNPFNERSFDVVNDLFGVKIPEQYTAWTDLQCNYIGFRSREDLLAYVEFYRPFFDYFFDAEWELRRDLTPFVKSATAFRNEKPLTYLLEFISHLFFFARDLPFFALHYQGFYEIDERRRRLKRLERPSWHTPGWLANWYFMTRVVQPAWPYFTPERQGWLMATKAKALAGIRRQIVRVRSG